MSLGAQAALKAVRAFRANIARVAANSGQARQAWIADKFLEGWLIWTIWQKTNPTFANQAPVEPRLSMYRDTSIALTKRGEDRPEARDFAAFLASPTGAGDFHQMGLDTSGKMKSIGRSMPKPSTCPRIDRLY